MNPQLGMSCPSLRPSTKVRRNSGLPMMCAEPLLAALSSNTDLDNLNGVDTNQPRAGRTPFAEEPGQAKTSLWGAFPSSTGAWPDWQCPSSSETHTILQGFPKHTGQQSAAWPRLSLQDAPSLALAMSACQATAPPHPIPTQRPGAPACLSIPPRWRSSRKDQSQLRRQRGR